MLQCGFVRSNFSLAMALSVQSFRLRVVIAIRRTSSGLLPTRSRHFLVVVELHREGRAALDHGAQVVHVAEHVHERHHRIDDVGVAAHVLALDLPAPRIEVADDGAGVIFRRHHLDLHDRLEQDRLALLQRFAQSRARGDFEGQRRRVDVVVGAVDQRDLEVDHREAGEHACVQHRLEALFDARDVFLRHRAADDLVLELEPRAGRRRLDDDLDARELAGAAGLLLVGVVDLGALRDLLAVGHLRRADIGVDLVGAPEDVDFDVEMQFAHALEDGLAALLVGRDPERRILGRQLGSATPSFSWSAFDFGSIAISMTGSGNSIFSRITGCLGSHSVSPVRTSLRPASATMSPA